MDGGTPITSAGERVLGFSHARVRVALTPSAAGDHVAELELANMRDPANAPRLKLLALVSSQHLAEELLVSIYIYIYIFT